MYAIKEQKSTHGSRALAHHQSQVIGLFCLRRATPERLPRNQARSVVHVGCSVQILSPRSEVGATWRKGHVAHQKNGRNRCACKNNRKANVMTDWTLDDWLNNWRLWAEPWNSCGPVRPKMCGSIERLHIYFRGNALTAEEVARFEETGDFRGPVPSHGRQIVDIKRGVQVEHFIVALPTCERQPMVLRYMFNVRVNVISDKTKKRREVIEQDISRARMKLSKAVSTW